MLLNKACSYRSEVFLSRLVAGEGESATTTRQDVCVDIVRNLCQRFGDDLLARVFRDCEALVDTPLGNAQLFGFRHYHRIACCFGCGCFRCGVLVNKFLDAWKYIFGQSSYLHSTDSTQIFREAKGSQESDSGLFKFCKQYRDAEKKYGHYPFFAPVVNALEMFDSLDALKDPKTFFEKVVDLREDAHNLMDTVRQVLAFTRDQMENYKDILAFIRDNRENFNLLDDKYKEKVTEIMGLESQPWPVVMSDYLDLKDDLTVALDKIRKQLRDEIKAAYEKAYAELVQGAKDSGVDESVVTNPENIIFSKSQTGNIYALQSNRNVDEYFTAQAAKIQKAKLAATATNGGGSTSGTGTGTGTGTSGYSTDDSSGSTSHAAEPKVMNLNLVTRTTAVLSNESEVDAYLSSLKKQMMDKINDGWQLTITQ